MPPTKVCPQCKAAVPIRWKTCECCDHVFRFKRKAECNLREKAMKRMRAVESDSMKSTRKAKGKWHKTCERGSEICEQTLHRQEQNRLRMVSMRASRGSDRFYNQHTSTITCTVAPRVWHFSAFHCFVVTEHRSKLRPHCL